MAPLAADVDLIQHEEYYPAPHSLVGLSKHMKQGLLALGAISTTSASFLIFVIVALTWRLAFHWNVNRRNQCFVSVYNLFVADLVQAISLMISFHWIAVDGILAPSNVCFAQGFLLNLGDLGSGSFVLLISIQTSIQVFRDRPMAHWLFILIVILVWIACILLSALGPFVNHSAMRFFTRAGNWCWISDDYEGARLGLHYFWIFAFQLFSSVIYIFLYVWLYVRAKLIRRNAAPGTEEESEVLMRKIHKAITSLVFYPLIYIALTLPLAVCRMRIMSKRPVSNFALLISGCMIVSSGICDAIFYTLSRSILRNTPVGESTQAAPVPPPPPPPPAPPPPSIPLIPQSPLRAPCTRQRVRSGWSSYPIGLDTNEPALTGHAGASAPASSHYSSRANSQTFEGGQSSHDELIAREAGSSTLAPHAIPLTPLSHLAQANRTANGSTSPMPSRGLSSAPNRGHRRPNKSDTTFFARARDEGVPEQAEESQADTSYDSDGVIIPRLVRSRPNPEW